MRIGHGSGAVHGLRRTAGGASTALIVGAVLLLAIVAVALWARPRAELAMTVTVTVTTDEEGMVEVYRTKVLSAASRSGRPVMEASIDLSQWDGKLVRVDIKGNIHLRGLPAESIGYVGCSAELRGQGVAGPIEFVGWQNEDSSKVHVGSLGPRAFAAGGTGSPFFVYASEGSLWHVLRVPEEATLWLSLTPVLAREVKKNPKRAIPSFNRAIPVVSSRVKPKRPPDVFIYLLDALRADHLGCYGYDRNTSPSIDAFAAEAVLFEYTYTPAPWTHAAVPSLLTGLYPCVHGSSSHKDKLDTWPVLLAEAVKEAGYRTYHVTTVGHASKKFGLDQGYDGFEYKLLGSTDWVNSHVARFLTEGEADAPVFMYLHSVGPHSPYVPEPASRQLFDRGFVGACDGSAESLKAVGWVYPRLSDADVQHLIDLYDAQMFDADQGFAEFLGLLRNAGRLDDALIVVVADHGEAFTEHDNLQHGRTLSKEEMQVPLIIRFPGGRFAGLKVKRRASLIDVFPTVLSITGAAPALPYRLPGVDLTRYLLYPSSEDTGRHVYGEVSWGEDDRLDMVAVTDEEGYKRVIDMSPVPGKLTTSKAVGMWDTSADPDEQVDLTESLPVRAAYHEQLLARWLVEQEHWRDAASGRPSPTVEMTEELKRGLRALGYLD